VYNFTDSYCTCVLEVGTWNQEESQTLYPCGL
jgi:hypothetical protein